MTIQLYHGDCLEIMPTLAENSVDAIVCDPPYGLSFMGKDWDHGVPGVHFWSEALRVAKPGAHLLAFGGTRTFHRLACAIEDAGWEIRDTLIWCYGSGFPKSLDVSKAIDKAAGAEREVVGHNGNGRPNRAGKHNNALAQAQTIGGTITAPATPDAARWAGWGTALKPSFEPVIMARKPFKGNVAANVLEWGTGAINVDASRVGTNEELGRPQGTMPHPTNWGNKSNGNGVFTTQGNTAGRWPPNLLHDGSDEVTACFPVTTSGAYSRQARKRKGFMLSGSENNTQEANAPDNYGDAGSAARFFPALGYDEDDATRLMYCAKASRSDRDGSPHPTMKPTKLMRWLVRLVTPLGGVVLDPFMGSGSTGKACALEGFGFVGIEQEAEYVEIARRRIEAAQLPLLVET